MMKAARPGALTAILCITVPAMVFVACGAAIPPPCPPCGEGENCGNYPFRPTDCWTTKHGPAKADVMESSTNMLYCKEGAFALCFFSGPPTPTGKNPDNQPLPCVLKGDIASCTCQVYTSGPSFVDINGILNLGAYQQTVQACGQDGSKCANLSTCGKDGTKSGCGQLQQAPVCQYVQNQDPNDPTVSLMPKADLVSTFSMTAMAADYQIGSTPCEGRYAGCMTAPCSFAPGAKQPPSNGDPITCECPTFTGKYQIGQFRQQCEIPDSNGASYVWSAANNVSGGSLE